MTQRPFSSFTILIFFAVFIIAGVALAPFIPVQLKPDYTLPTVSVRYTWSGAQPRAIEQEGTSPLEGLFATMRGIKNVRSESGIGSGQITIEFDKSTDMEMARFEVAAAVRRYYPFHLLAKLYDETGQKEKTVAMAKEVMEKEVKIESKAIEEIKTEMKNIIKKQDSKAISYNKLQIQNTSN